MLREKTKQAGGQKALAMTMAMLLLLLSRFSRVRWGVVISDRGRGKPDSRADS